MDHERAEPVSPTCAVTEQSFHVSYVQAPWKITEGRGPDGEFCFWEIRDSNTRTILSSWPGATKRQVRIAAVAPDMLEALKEAAELLNDHYSDIDKNGNANGAMRLVSELRDIIAKAGG